MDLRMLRAIVLILKKSTSRLIKTVSWFLSFMEEHF